MTDPEQWRHRWFGVWREYGPSYEYCPSIRDFVNPAISAQYDKVRLRHYLTTAQVVACTSRTNFPCPFTGQRSVETISFRTDGAWLWLDDLADYIDEFDLTVPLEFLEHIKRNAYAPPTVDRRAIERLEWPRMKYPPR